MKTVFSMLQTTQPGRDQKVEGGEPGCHSWMDCLAAEFFNICFSDTVFVSLFRTVVETAISGEHKLRYTDGFPNYLTLFWQWLGR